MARKKIITVGSDPEFLITDHSGNYIPADKFFNQCGDCNPCEKCGRKRCTGNRVLCGICKNCEDVCEDCDACCGCESCRDQDPEDCDFCYDCMDNGDCDLDGEIGCDGCSEVGELRPMFGETPHEHHNNIATLIDMIDVPKKYELHAGTRVDGFDLGGHIHLGFRGKKETYEYGESLQTDLYISKYAGMPLRKIEHPSDLAYRGLQQYGYGQFGSHSDRRYGIEWRMPASWLVSSDIALSALCLAHMVILEYYVEPEIITLPTVESQKKTLGSSTFASRYIARLEKMKYYPNYKEELEPLFQMLTNGEEWDTETDIREMW